MIASSLSAKHDPASFSTAGWRASLLLVLSLAALYRVDRHFNGEKEIHPISSLLQTMQSSNTGEQAAAFDAISIPQRRQHADDLLILGSKERIPSGPIRWTFAHGRDRASDFIIPVGSSITMPSDEEMKWSYQRNDDIKDKVADSSVDTEEES